MRRRNLLAIGFQLGWPRDRVGWARCAVVALALGVAWPVVLISTAWPGLVQARTERAAALQVREGPPPGGSAAGRYALRTDRWRGHPVALMFVAPPTGAAAPPGLDEWPKAGSAGVSPSLKRVLAETSAAGLRERVGPVADVIDDDGLVSPEDLRAYIVLAHDDPRWSGTDADVGPDSASGAFWGFDTQAPDATGKAARWTLGLLLVALGPLVGLMVACLRFAGTTRDRQMAALRLLGLDAYSTTVVLIGTLLVPLAAGAVAGTGAFLAGNRTMASRGLAGRTWFAEDLQPTWAAVAAGVMVVAGLLALARNRAGSAVAEPLAVRRDRPPAPLRGRTLIPLGLGITMFGLIVVGASPRIDPDLDLGARVFAADVAATVLAVLGLLAGAPAIAALAGRCAGSRAKRVGTHIAGRSLEADPRGTARAVSLIGIVLVVGVLGIGFVRAIDAGAANADTAPPDTAVVDQVHTPDLPEAIRHSLTTPVAPVWALTGATPTGPEGVLVARCRDLTEVIRGARGCRSGALVHRLPSASSQMMGAGQQLDLDLGDPDATVAGELRPSATVHTAAPRLLLPEDPGRLFGGRSGTVLVDPEAPGLTVVRQRAPDLVLVRLRVPSDADRLREVLAEVDPLAQIHTSASYRAAWQAEQPLDARAAEALLAAIVSLVLAAVGVTTVDRITARRPLDVQILALGAPRGEVRRAAAMAVLLPATAVVPAVAITVLLADLSWDRVIHEPLAIDTVVLASLAAATAVLAALAAVLAITVTRVEAQPEALHRE